MNRARPLSDDAVMSECAAYRSIPMHMSENVLSGNKMKKNAVTLGVKKLKYEKHLSRPDTYDVMSKNLSKMSGPGQEEMLKMMHRNYTNNLKGHSNANLHGNISLEGDSTFGSADPPAEVTADAPANPPANPPGSGPPPPSDDDDDDDDDSDVEYEEAPETRDELGTPPRASAGPPQFFRGNVNNDNLGSPPSGSQSAEPPAGPPAGPPAEPPAGPSAGPPAGPSAGPPAAPVNIPGTFTAFNPDEPHQQNAHEKPQRKAAQSQLYAYETHRNLDFKLANPNLGDYDHELPTYGNFYGPKTQMQEKNEEDKSQRLMSDIVQAAEDRVRTADPLPSVDLTNSTSDIVPGKTFRGTDKIYESGFIDIPKQTLRHLFTHDTKDIGREADVLSKSTLKTAFRGFQLGDDINRVHQGKIYTNQVFSKNFENKNPRRKTRFSDTVKEGGKESVNPRYKPAKMTYAQEKAVDAAAAVDFGPSHDESLSRNLLYNQVKRTRSGQNY